MVKLLGYDCNGKEIYEYRILRATWSHEINVKKLENVDARLYCAVSADDGTAYAISVYDWWSKYLIKKREHIREEEEIPVIIKPINELENYEVAFWNGDEDEFYYTLDRDELKNEVNKSINNKPKVLTKKEEF